jgi:hypothetical protein
MAASRARGMASAPRLAVSVLTNTSNTARGDKTIAAIVRGGPGWKCPSSDRVNAIGPCPDDPPRLPSPPPNTLPPTCFVVVVVDPWVVVVVDAVWVVVVAAASVVVVVAAG